MTSESSSSSWKSYGRVVNKVDLIFSTASLQTLWKSKDFDVKAYVESSPFWKTTTSLTSERKEYGPILKGLNDCATTALFEFHCQSLVFAHGRGLQAPQGNVVASLFAHIIRASVRLPSVENLGELLTQQETFVLFRDILMDIFREGKYLQLHHCQLLTNFISQSFFLHYKLFQYILAHVVDRDITHARAGQGSLPYYGSQFYYGIEMDCFNELSAPPTVTYEKTTDAEGNPIPPGENGEAQRVIQPGCLKGFKKRTYTPQMSEEEAQRQAEEVYDWRAHGFEPLEDEGAEGLINDALERTVERTDERLKRLHYLKQKRKH